MYKFARIPTFIFIIATLLFSTGCGSPQNTQPANTQIQIDELSTDSTAVEEVVHINNCGGKGDAVQTAEHSFGTDIEGVGGGQIGIPVIQGNISAKYGQYRNVTKSQQLVAPPGTNMKIVLKWSEEIHAGKILLDGVAGTYKAHIPIAVEQVSSQDLGCGNSVAPATEPASTPIPEQTKIIAQQETIYNCPSYHETGVGKTEKLLISVPVGEIAFINTLEFDDKNNGVFITVTGPYDGYHTLRDGAVCSGIPANADYQPVREQRRQVQNGRTWDIALP